MCHIGFSIPVNYTDYRGRTYLFHEMKPKIKNLDPNTAMERIFGHGFCEFEIPEHLIRLGFRRQKPNDYSVPTPESFD